MEEQKIMFDGTEGELIITETADTMKKGHQSRRKELLKSKTDNYVEAEFFGLKKFNALVKNFEKDCVGFRVYYGSQFEDHSNENILVTEEGRGKKTSRLVIVPVDAYGNDLTSANLPGMKDMAGGPSALAVGPVCPNRCAPPKVVPGQN